MPRPKGSKNVVQPNFPEGRELELVEVPPQDISTSEALPDEKGQGVPETIEGELVVLDKKESDKLNERFQGKPNFTVKPVWEVKEFIDTADVYEGATLIRTYSKHIHGDNFLDLAHQIVAKFNTKK